MSSPSSIPGYQRGPILNRSGKLILASLLIVPIGSYVYLKSRQAESKKETRQMEEEGRRNWIQAEKGSDYKVEVGRSGGGI